LSTLFTEWYERFYGFWQEHWKRVQQVLALSWETLAAFLADPGGYIWTMIINVKSRYLTAHKFTVSRFLESCLRYLWEGEF